MTKGCCPNPLCKKIIIIDLEKFKKETNEVWIECPYCGIVFKNPYLE